MTQVHLSALLFLLITGGAALMLILWGWKKRTAAGSKIELSDLVGDVFASFERVKFVAVTPVGEPLVRVNVPGLTFRGNATVAVHSAGVSVQVQGEEVRTMTTPMIRGADTAQTRIDRTVERDGLTILVWEYDGTEYETVFRFDSPADQVSFLTAVRDLPGLSSHITPSTLEEDA